MKKTIKRFAILLAVAVCMSTMAYASETDTDEEIDTGVVQEQTEDERDEPAEEDKNAAGDAGDKASSDQTRNDEPSDKKTQTPENTETNPDQEDEEEGDSDSETQEPAPEVTAPETDEENPEPGTEEPDDGDSEAPEDEEQSAKTPEAPNEAEAPFEASVRIKLQNEGDIYFGDTVTLRALVEANADYTVAWEVFNDEAEPGEDPWVELETGETYTFIVDEENAGLIYRAVVNEEVASEEYQLPTVGERPQEPQPEEEELPETAEEEQVAERSIQIRALFDGKELSYGDEVTLIAELSGYDGVAYELQWQTSADDAEWTDVPDATGASHTITVTEENYYAFWRVIATITEM